MKKMSGLIVTGIMILSVLPGIGKAGWIRTYSRLSESGYGFWVEKTSDNGFIITGSFLIKTDSLGDTLWTRDFDKMGRCVQKTSDGGYVVVGEEYPYLWLLKTDMNGDTYWTRKYGEREAIGYCVRQASKGGYFISGGTVPPPPAGRHVLWILRTDSLGDTLWTRSYQDSGYYIGYSLELTSDGGCIATGRAKGVPLIKVDSLGTTTWMKTHILGNPEVVDAGYSIQMTSDDGYIISGIADEGGLFTSGALFLLKTDSLGDSLWAKIYDPTSVWDAGASCHQTPDGGYIIAGTQDFSIQHTGKIWLLKTDSDGEMLWERTFEGDPDARGDCLALCSDGGYAVTGFMSVNGSPDIVLIKTDSLGFVGVEESSSIPPPPPLWNVASAVGSEIVLKYKYLPQGFALTIYDTSGRKVDEIRPVGPSGELHWGKGQVPGVYIIRERQGSRTKVVLVR